MRWWNETLATLAAGLVGTIGSDSRAEAFAFEGEATGEVAVIDFEPGDELVVTLWPEGLGDGELIAWSGPADGAFGDAGFGDGVIGDHGFVEAEPGYEFDVTMIRGIEEGAVGDGELHALDEPYEVVAFEEEPTEFVVDWIDEGIDPTLEDGEVFVPEGPLDELIYATGLGPNSSVPEPRTVLLGLAAAALTLARGTRRSAYRL